MRVIFLIGLMLLFPAGMRGATKPYGQWSNWLHIKDPGFELYYRVLAYQTSKTDSWHHQLELQNRGTVIVKVVRQYRQFARSLNFTQQDKSNCTLGNII